MKSDQELEFEEKNIQGKLKGLEKKINELQKTLESEESKLKSSLKSKKQSKKKEKDDEEEIGFRYHNSDDEVDEFFDRTKQNKFKGNISQPSSTNQDQVETYESLKSKLENLYKERQKLTSDLQDVQQGKKKPTEEEEDELELFMKQNED